MCAKIANVAGLSIALVSLAGAAAGQTASVARALNGLGVTDTLNKQGGGMITVGLRGDDAAGANPSYSTRLARIGFIESDGDNGRASPNGFINVVANMHPALRRAFGHNGAVRDFADGNPAPGAYAAGTNHATHVAGIALSNDAANGGMAPRAIGYMTLFDDSWANGLLTPRLYNPGHFAQLEAAGDYLADGTPQQVAVINASWGYRRKVVPGPGVPPNPPEVVGPLTQADLNGVCYGSKLFDWYAYQRDVMVVKSAGNTGGLITIPGDHYNGLTVGALGPIPGGTPNAVVGVRPLSSRNPLAGGRNGVHLVAPGSNITGPRFDNGGTGYATANGTSEAAAHVSGMVANLWSAGRQAIEGNGRTDKGDVFTTDHKLLKSVLINSARKIPGAVAGGAVVAAWAPGQVDPGDDKKWLHPLNYVVGSGELDGNEAWLEYREKTASITAGTYENRWWDTGSVAAGVNYRTDTFTQFALPNGNWITGMTATLCWDRHEFAANFSNAMVDPVSNLDLLFEYSLNGGGAWTNILSSVSPNDSTEHVYLTGLGRFGAANQNAIYRLRVQATALAAGLGNEGFALSVHYFAVPTPGPTALLFLAGLIAGGNRRR